MNSESKICRLCLNTCDIFDTIAEDTKETLNQLNLKIDLSKTEKAIICGKCSEAIQKWFEFKSFCLQKQGYVNGEPSPDESASNKKEDNRSENNSNCCLCMKTVAISDHSVLLTRDEKSVTSLKIILLQYFREIDINRTKNPVICASCLESLKSCSIFITSCLEGEEKVKKYCKANGLDSKEHVELNCILENKNFIFLSEIKPEESYSTATVSNSVNVDAILEAEDKKINIKYEDLPEQSPQENILSTQSSYKSKQYIHKKHLISRDSKNSKILCVHESTHKCTKCTFETKRKSSLSKHMIVHKSSSDVTMHKCTTCSFQTKYKAYLKTHLLTHKKPNEVTMHKCHICDYQTKFNSSLRRHDTLVHKNSSEITMYKCHLCDHQTKIKGNLLKHMSLHESNCEGTMYKCQLCKYQTRTKHHLRRHLIVHKSMYECLECNYEAKTEHSLQQHILIHKSCEETRHECKQTGGEGVQQALQSGRIQMFRMQIQDQMRKQLNVRLNS